MSSKNIVDLRSRERKPEREEPVQRRREAPPQETPRARFAERNAALRARRRKRWLITVIILLVLVGGAAYGISYVSYLPKYSVTQATITGEQAVSSSDLQAFVQSQLQPHPRQFISSDNVLRFNAGDLEKAIVARYPLIASAQVTRSSLFATAITVTITERQPFALWCTDDSQTDCYYMDQTGFIFEQAPSQQQTSSIVTQADASTTAETASSTPQTQTGPTSPNSNNSMYVFEGAIATSSSPIGQTFVGAHLPGILAFFTALGQAGVTPEGATIENDTDFDVSLTQGFYLKASFGEDPQQLVQNLQLVLSSDSLQNDLSSLEYVDLRFGDRVYYKLKGEDQTQAPSASQSSQ